MKKIIAFFVFIIAFIPIRASVDPWYKDKSEWTKLMNAVYKNRLYEVQKILKDDTLIINKITSRGLTAMIIAIRKNNFKIVKLLYNNDYYIHLNILNPHNSEIREACIYSNLKIINFFLQNDLKQINKSVRIDTFIFIPHLICHRSLKVLKFFNNNDIDWNLQRCSRYPTILFCVVSYGKIRKTKYLLEHGADKNIKNKEGRKASEIIEYEHASKRKKKKLQKLLE